MYFSFWKQKKKLFSYGRLVRSNRPLKFLKINVFRQCFFKKTQTVTKLTFLLVKKIGIKFSGLKIWITKDHPSLKDGTVNLLFCFTDCWIGHPKITHESSHLWQHSFIRCSIHETRCIIYPVIVFIHILQYFLFVYAVPPYVRAFISQFKQHKQQSPIPHVSSQYSNKHWFSHKVNIDDSVKNSWY